MINLARNKDEDLTYVDTTVVEELTTAKIEPFNTGRTQNGEVTTKYIGFCCGWTFKRAWYYYMADGPGIPLDKAEEFHKVWGKQVRVDGDCGCPSPLEQCHGFAVGSYHIDTQEGLNAFTDLLRSIYKP